MSKVKFISNEVPSLIKAYVKMTDPLHCSDKYAQDDIKAGEKDVIKTTDNKIRSNEVTNKWKGNIPVICNTQSVKPEK